MGKYGKKSVVDPSILKHSIAIAGQSGVGKTTLMVNVLNKLAGPEGYILFNCGKEQGVSEMANATYEDIEDYKKWDAVTKDIIENKTKDYPDLKVIVIDTVDQLIEITAPYIVKLWNEMNRGAKDFKPCKTLNAAFSGFGKGEDKLGEVLLDRIWQLKEVGITTYFVFHIKTRNIVDPITNSSYDILSANISQRLFEIFKTKIAILATIAIDRTIETQDTGRRNIVTHKSITTNKVIDESRKIYFRSDNFVVDCKSRFSEITPVIPLDADMFIETIQDAINKEIAKQNGTNPVIEVPKEEVKQDIINEDSQEEDLDVEESIADESSVDGDIFEEETTEDIDYPENLAEAIRSMIRKSADAKTKCKVILKKMDTTISKASQEELKSIYSQLM